MAQPDIIRGTYFVLGVGNGGSPETFTALCGISTRTFRHSHNTSPQFTRDCALPISVPIQRLIVTGESWSLSGNGDLNRTQLSVLQTLDDGQTHNFRFYYTEPAGDLHYQGYYQGPAIITSLEITGNDSQYGTIAISLESDGQWTFTVV
jgi:hypothetical protein